MGCLLVDIVSPTLCTVHIVEDLNESLEVDVIGKTSGINTSISEVLSYYSAILHNTNVDLDISIQSKNVSPKVTVALICRIGTDEWLYLHVLEGNIITIDGQYIKVLREYGSV